MFAQRDRISVLIQVFKNTKTYAEDNTKFKTQTDFFSNCNPKHISLNAFQIIFIRKLLLSGFKLQWRQMIC